MGRKKYSELSDEELVTLYEINAIKHGDAQDQGNNRKGNPAADVLFGLSEELKLRDHRIALFKGLMENKQSTVRKWAAGHALDLVPEIAVPVLEDIVREGGLNGFAAKWTLKAWRERGSNLG